MKQSGFLKQVKAKRDAEDYQLGKCVWCMAYQFALDMATISMVRNGVSPKKTFTIIAESVEKYGPDFKGVFDPACVEADALRERMDGVLHQIYDRADAADAVFIRKDGSELKPRFMQFEDRYPEVRKIDNLGNWMK